MNQTQINNFLMCLNRIDDPNYLSLHMRTAALNSGYLYSNAATNTSSSDDDHDHDHDHDHDDDTSNSRHDLLIAKVTAMVVLFCASSLCGSIPFMLNRCFKWTDNNVNARSATVVKCLLYFGGGVLLCTTFLHLLPEVQEVVEQLQENHQLPALSFALPELLMCCGFLLMYLIEECIHSFMHRNKNVMNKDAGAGAAFERGHSVRNSYLVKGGKSKEQQLADMEEQQEQQQAQQQSEAQQQAATVTALAEEPRNMSSNGVGTISVQDLIANDAENQKYQAYYDKNNHSHHHHNDYQHDHHHHDHHDHHEHGHTHLPIGTGNSEDGVVTSSIRGLLIVLALSLHELFEGMAIGLEGSASSVWFMFGAVSAHKLVLAFCVAVELIVARTRTALSIVYVITFAIVSPIGIGVGILISHNNTDTTASIPSAILQGMACGTLLYVVFFEILSKNHSGLVAYCALVVGFGLMFGLQQLDNDSEHGHSHGGKSTGSSADSTGQPLSTTTAAPTAATNSPLSFEEQLQILRQASQELLQNNKKNI